MASRDEEVIPEMDKADKAAYDKARRTPMRAELNALEAARRAAATPEEIEKRRAYHRAYYAKHRDKWHTPERRAYARELKRRMAREHPEETRYKARVVKLKSTYNLSIERFEAMREAQGDVCAVCRQPETTVIKGAPLLLSVDHDHSCCPGKKSCGKCIRGLLCFRCNAVMGNLNDDREILRAMLAYLG